MLIRTIRQYDVRHTGDNSDRTEILMAFRALADLIEKADLAEVTITSEKTDLISVTIEQVDAP